MSYIFEQVKLKKEAIEVVFRCEDGYSTSITLQEALEDGVIRID
jgi:DMSO/TMAO reductase YedYZ molybdopterin-dependent catalytic subunit